MSIDSRDVISVAQFTREKLERYFDVANRSLAIARGQASSRALEGKLLANLFFEPSTRTRLSFGSAFLRLGGALETTVGMQFSSMAKGETLEDTIRVIDGYADVIVLRHPEIGSARRAAAAAQCPVVNAGDGPGEHPTQALLDLYTIFKERGTVDGTTVALIGDLRYGRTVHSLARTLTLFEDTELLLVSPEELAMPVGILEFLSAQGVSWRRATLDEAVAHSDVLYVTRLQAERFADPSQASRFMGTYVVDRELIEKHGRAKDLTILHPLPRYGDLSSDVDALPGAAYFRQAHYGVPVRMALFCEIFGVDPEGHPAA